MDSVELPFTRLMRRVEISPSGCWLWRGVIDRGGYGLIHVGSRTDGTKGKALVHRLAYEVMVGPIPDGKTIDHLCRVRNCVNADHLEAVSLAENILRGTSPAAIHARQTHCLRGHELPQKRRIDGARVCEECIRLRVKETK